MARRIRINDGKHNCRENGRAEARSESQTKTKECGTSDGHGPKNQGPRTR
jgi:hypothetical protein